MAFTQSNTGDKERRSKTAHPAATERVAKQNSRATFRVAESRRWCELKSATLIDPNDGLWCKGDTRQSAHVGQVCQQEAHAAQQIASLLDHLVGAGL